MPKIGIAGAGLIGRLLALNLINQGHQVTLFDRDEHGGKQSCGYIAGGMIATLSELTLAEPLIKTLGERSLELWPQLLQTLHHPVYWQQNGSLVIAHAEDRAKWQRYKTILQNKIGLQEFQLCEKEQLFELEPELNPHFRQALFMPNEAHIANDELFSALEKNLLKKNITWHAQTSVLDIQVNKIITDESNYNFDQVFDCRGMGAKKALTQLRGLRGEIIFVRAPEVTFSRPIRLLHPRYSLYIVPRPNNIYAIGATSIESEDYSSISAQSILELLSAALTVHRGFAEARIIHTFTNCRPALPDHSPKIIINDSVINLNGFYRHGYTAGPAVIEDALRYWRDGETAMNFPELLSVFKCRSG